MFFDFKLANLADLKLMRTRCQQEIDRHVASTAKSASFKDFRNQLPLQYRSQELLVYFYAREQYLKGRFYDHCIQHLRNRYLSICRQIIEKIYGFLGQ